MRKIKMTLLAMLGVAWLAACGGPVPNDAMVVQRGAEFFAALQAKDFDRALDFYAEEFFRSRPREQWKAYLLGVREKLGDMQSFELRRQQADVRYSGKFFIYEYSVVYANEKAWETVTYFVPNSGAEVKVFGHQIKAKGI